MTAQILHVYYLYYTIAKILHVYLLRYMIVKSIKHLSFMLYDIHKY